MLFEGAATLLLERGQRQQEDTKLCNYKRKKGGRPRAANEIGDPDDQRGNEGVASARSRNGIRRGLDGMARGAGEPSAKRAKVDEADEEEDRLVRRKEKVVRLLERVRKGKDNARAKKELLTLCARLEAKNEKLLGRLLPELWQKIIDENVQQNDMLALAMACRFFREKQKDLGKKVVTNLYIYRLLDLRKGGKIPSYSLGWFRWVCGTFEIQPGFAWWPKGGAVYEGSLLNYAALQCSVEILKWLMEEKGWELNEETGFWVGMGGSVEVLEHLRGKGYEFDEGACQGAVEGGHLEALKFLRGLDPPCPWAEGTCAYAVQGGHLEILKWARSQDPPCPWSRRDCRDGAFQSGHQHIIDWIDQQEDESDVEYREFSDGDDPLAMSDSNGDEIF